MDGNLEAKLLGLEEVIRMSVSIILLHFEEPTSWSAEVGEKVFSCLWMPQPRVVLPFQSL